MSCLYVVSMPSMSGDGVGCAGQTPILLGLPAYHPGGRQSGYSDTLPNWEGNGVAFQACGIDAKVQGPGATGDGTRGVKGKAESSEPLEFQACRGVVTLCSK